MREIGNTQRTSGRWIARALLAGLSSLAMAVPAGAAPAATAATVIRNGQPGTVRLDDQGNAIDAHDGDLQYVAGRYYLYGTQYGCGFRWNHKGAAFCGFHAYSSADLNTWHDEGPLFQAATPAWQARCDGSTYGCFRPHVVYNQRTKNYVLWINSYDVGVGYHVLTSPSPAGPFTEVALPTLAINKGLPAGLNHGDHDVFVDTDGTAYLAYTDWRRKGDIVIEQLDEQYTSGTGRYARLGFKATEAPSLFRRGSTYYLTYSDPNCGYCATGTSYVRASSPLGPWQGKQDPASAPDGMRHGWPLSNDSCGGQPADVATLPGTREPVYLFQSDRWHHGDVNEALATHYQEPLRFDAHGAIQPLTCADSFTLHLATPGASGALGVPAPDTTTVPLAAERTATQGFPVPGAGRLASVSVGLYRSSDGSGTLRLRVLRGALTIATRVVAADELSWSPRQVSVPVNTAVSDGDVLTVMIDRIATTPSFGALVHRGGSASIAEAFTVTPVMAH